LQLFSSTSNFATLHGNDHTIEIRFVYVVFFILKGVLKDIEGGIFSIYLIIVLNLMHFIIVMTFLVRECYGSPKKQEF
jgi:hypothetical protein